MSVLHLHTHPSCRTPSFSMTDDSNERRYAEFLRSYRPRAHFLSAVFDQEMNHSSCRSWNLSCGTHRANVRFDVDGLGIARDVADVARDSVDIDMMSRQLVFGDEFLRNLGEVSLTVIGCGGIGSVFVEQMSRLGVRKWVLVDPDTVEASNLNRLPFASRRDIGRFKTSLSSALIRRTWGKGCSVKQIRRDIRDAKVVSEAVKSTYLIVASDNHYSRAIAQEISSRFVRPIVSLASQIYKDTRSNPRYYVRVVCPPTAPNRWSLISCQAVDLYAAARETAPKSIRDELDDLGYIDGVKAPAVYWLNSIGASLGVKIIQEKVLGMKHKDGIDWLIDCGRNEWHRLSHKDDDSCLYTSNRDDGLFGKGFHKIGRTGLSVR